MLFRNNSNNNFFLNIESSRSTGNTGAALPAQTGDRGQEQSHFTTMPTLAYSILARLRNFAEKIVGHLTSL